MPLQSLVTGGAGFVGSHLCERLLSEPDSSVICLDNLGSGRRANVKHLLDDPNFRFVEGDVRDDLSALPSVDRIYHLASRASPKDFDEHALEIATTTTVGSHNVYEFARQHDARVVIASTSEVYGEPEQHPQTESYNGNVDPRSKRAPYDEGKRFAETLATLYAGEYGVDIRTARIFNTYGPRMRPDDGRVIPTFVRQALAGENLTVYGDGSQTRSFCYVSDLVAGLVSLADEEGLADAVVNLGNTKEITIMELAETVNDQIDTSAGITTEPLPEADPSRRQPDISRARELLDWEPSVSLEAGLERTIDAWERHEERVATDK